MNVPPQSNYPRAGSGGGGVPLRGPGIYFDYIGIAWKMITKNPSVYIVGGLVLLIAMTAVSVPISLLSNVLMYGSVMPDAKAQQSPNFMMFPVQMVLNLISGGVNTALMTGIALATIEEADTGSTKFETLFSGFKNFPNLLLGSVLYSLAVGVGMLFCIVPGIYLAGALAFTNLFVICNHVSGVDGLKKSFEILKPYAWSMFGLSLVAGCVSGLGVILCGIGIIVTWPIHQVVMGLHFREFRSASNNA